MTRVFSVLFALGTLILSGCSSSDSTTNPPGATYYVTAKIDGADFSTSGGTAVGFMTSGTLTVTGNITTAGTTRQISFVLDDAAAGKSYNMATNTDDSGVVLMMGTLPTDSYLAGQGFGSGTIAITSMSGSEVSGTFSFVASNGVSTKTVTGGSFKVKYTTI